jgi:hypothetical protein
MARVEKIRHVGLSGEKHRELKRQARAFAIELIRRMDRDLYERSGEFAMEVHQALVIGLSARMVQGTTPGRAVGVLASAAAGVCPGWNPPRRAAGAAAEKLFAKTAEAQ